MYQYTVQKRSGKSLENILVAKNRQLLEDLTTFRMSFEDPSFQLSGVTRRSTDVNSY
jgi:hypothetical protein